MTSKLLFSHALLVFLLLLQVCAASMAKEEEKSVSSEWGVLEEAFNNLTSMAEGSTSYRVTSEAYMYYYTIVYDSCAGNPVAASQFHDAYKTSFEDYITSKILPSLQRSRKEDLVGNLVKSWSNYKLVTRWFSKFMYYLNRYYIPENHLPSLELTSYLCFYDKVYGELHDQIKDAVLTMIRDERMGNQIDEKLLSDVQEMYHDMAKRSDEHAHYSKELVESMSSDYLSFLTIKALVEWTTADPSDAHEYVLKLKLRDCLEGAEGENIVASFGQDINPSQEYFRKVIERGLQGNWSTQASPRSVTLSTV